MDKLSQRKEVILKVLDDQIEELEEKLQKLQPLISELNQLKATRRVLLSEHSVTGRGGLRRVQLTMEQVIGYLREHGATADGNGRIQPQQIAEDLGVPGATVRSHFSRHRGMQYDRDEAGWYLIGETDRGLH
jgi:hypothetical protein